VETLVAKGLLITTVLIGTVARERGARNVGTFEDRA
jgi:hypothetical protein